MASNPRVITFTALLTGQPVESFSIVTTGGSTPAVNGSPAGYYGFTGIKFDTIEIRSTLDSETDNRVLLDNIEFESVAPPLIEVGVDIRPGEFPNNINRKNQGKIPVAILSTRDFDASTQVDRNSLTFGSTGDETSLVHCESADVNGDGLLDLVCHFNTQRTQFNASDAVGILKGQTISGTRIKGTDSIRIVH